MDLDVVRRTEDRPGSWAGPQVRNFPLHGTTWAAYRENPDLTGADEGEPGRGGWGYARSGTHHHRGIDLRVEIGRPVVAVEAGVVEYRSMGWGENTWNAAGHRIRLLGHSGAAYQYFHLGSSASSTMDAFTDGASCGSGRVVRAGQVIGYAGNTGGSVATRQPIPVRAAHLHFQFHPEGISGTDANPAQLFGMIYAAAPIAE